MIAPIAAFVFVLTFLGALSDIHRGKNWLPLAFFAALSFAALTYILTDVYWMRM